MTTHPGVRNLDDPEQHHEEQSANDQRPGRPQCVHTTERSHSQQSCSEALMGEPQRKPEHQDGDRRRDQAAEDADSVGACNPIEHAVHDLGKP